jgi:hypothetical protein
MLNFPKLWFRAPKVSAAVDNRGNIDSFSNDSVDEAVAPIEHLPDILAMCLRHDAANHRKGGQSFSARDNARDKISGVKIRVSGNVVWRVYLVRSLRWEQLR